MFSMDYKARIKNGKMCVLIITGVILTLLVTDFFVGILMKQAYSLDEGSLGSVKGFQSFLASIIVWSVLLHRMYNGKKLAKETIYFFTIYNIVINAIALKNFVEYLFWSSFTVVICINVFVLFIIFLILLTVKDIDIFMTSQREINEGIEPVEKEKDHNVELSQSLIKQIRNGKRLIITTLIIYACLGLGTIGAKTKYYLQAISNQELEQQDFILYLTSILFLTILLTTVYYFVLRGNMWAKAVVLAMIFFVTITKAITIFKDYIVFQSSENLYLNIAYVVIYIVLAMFILMSRSINLYIDRYTEVYGVTVVKE